MFEQVSFSCEDGYVLHGRFYAKQHTSDFLPILIGPATGIRQGFYQPFAEWLATQGYDVLSFDFRGIGDSLYEDVSKSSARVQDWGLYDLPAAVDFLLQKTNAAKILLIGHSAGGQLLGLMHNYHKVEKVIAIAGSSGNVKGLGGKTKILGPIMFNVIFPISTAFKGYAATKMLGMGENLPKGVGAQWREFCSKPGYAINAIGKTVDVDYHAEVRCPIISIHAADDEIATEHNVKDFLRIYPNAATRYITLDPKDYNHKAIGHMFMFKPSHQNLWPLIQQQLHSPS